MRDTLILIGLIVALIVMNRIAVYAYFREDWYDDDASNELQHNSIRNSVERTGITPGGVSYTELPEYAPYAPLERRYPKWVAAQGVRYTLKRKMGKWK